MGKFFYYLTASFDSVLSLAGIRSPYEQPPYQVVRKLPDHVEIRAYGARSAAETPVKDGNEGAAFGRLFRYIAGANHQGSRIAMTVPVERRLIPMTIPVETGAEMRFFLPAKLAKAGPPAPDDPLVHVVTLPPEQMAVLRFSGVADDASREAHLARLRAVLAEAHQPSDGEPLFLSYDPPWTLPFLRRNEVALRVAP